MPYLIDWYRRTTADLAHLVSILILLRKMKSSNVWLSPIPGLFLVLASLLRRSPRAVLEYHSNPKLYILWSMRHAIWVCSLVLQGPMAAAADARWIRHFLDLHQRLPMEHDLQAPLPFVLLIHCIPNAERLQANTRSKY